MEPCPPIPWVGLHSVAPWLLIMSFLRITDLEVEVCLLSLKSRQTRTGAVLGLLLALSVTIQDYDSLSVASQTCLSSSSL